MQVSTKAKFSLDKMCFKVSVNEFCHVLLAMHTNTRGQYVSHSFQAQRGTILQSAIQNWLLYLIMFWVG